MANSLFYEFQLNYKKTTTHRMLLALMKDDNLNSSRGSNRQRRT